MTPQPLWLSKRHGCLVYSGISQEHADHIADEFHRIGQEILAWCPQPQHAVSACKATPTSWADHPAVKKELARLAREAPKD